MDNQILEGILKQLQLIVKANESHYFIWLDYRVWALIIPFISALIVVYIAYRLKRRPKESKLVIIKASVDKQTDSFIGRLTISNEFHERAVNVEAYVKPIVYDNNKLIDYLPIPLRWTHGKVYNSEIRRDIFGKQTVYLDVFHYQEEPGKDQPVKVGLNKEDPYHFKLHSPITTLEYCTLKAGTTKLHIKLYQESGQEVEKKVGISWKKKGTPPELIILDNL